jgi:hypothetical protein
LDFPLSFAFYFIYFWFFLLTLFSNDKDWF